MYGSAKYVNSKQMSNIRKMYETTSIMQICLSLAQANYISKNISISLGMKGSGNELPLIPEVITPEELICWVNWLREVDIDLFLYGFSAFRYVKTEERKVYDLVDNDAESGPHGIDMFDSFVKEKKIQKIISKQILWNQMDHL